MAKPARIQLSRRAGFRLQEHSLALNGLPAVNCARPGKWGNPYLVLPCWHHSAQPDLGLPEFSTTDRAEAYREGARLAVAVYREHITAAATQWQTTRDALEQLRGKNLACWCRPDDPCHADVLLEIANS